MLTHIASFGPAVTAGLWAAALASALGSILGAPRILQTIANDGIAPRWFGLVTGPRKEPRNALLLTLSIAETGILFGDFDAIARVMSIVFLTTYAFPGNIRELENLIEQGVALADDGVLKREDIVTPEMTLAEGGPRREGGTELQDIVDEAERQHIEKTLREVEGNKERAAEILGLSSTTLWRKMKRLRVVAP